MRCRLQALQPKFSVLRAVLGVIALVGLLGAQLGTVAHEVLVKHATCAEHGELIHVAQAQETSESHAKSPALSSASSSDEAQHHHTHDPLSLHSREKWLWVAPMQVALAPPPVSHIDLDTQKHVARSRALYRLAPKSSPPV
jgi:hypothetical protein